MKLVEEGYAVGAGLNRGIIEAENTRPSVVLVWTPRRTLWPKVCQETGKRIPMYTQAFRLEYKSSDGTRLNLHTNEEQWMSQVAYTFKKLKGEL